MTSDLLGAAPRWDLEPRGVMRRTSGGTTDSALATEGAPRPARPPKKKTNPVATQGSPEVNLDEFIEVLEPSGDGMSQRDIWAVQARVAK